MRVVVIASLAVLTLPAPARAQYIPDVQGKCVGNCGSSSSSSSASTYDPVAAAEAERKRQEEIAKARKRYEESVGKLRELEKKGAELEAIHTAYLRMIDDARALRISSGALIPIAHGAAPRPASPRPAILPTPPRPARSQVWGRFEVPTPGLDPSPPKELPAERSATSTSQALATARAHFREANKLAIEFITYTVVPPSVPHGAALLEATDRIKRGRELYTSYSKAIQAGPFAAFQDASQTVVGFFAGNDVDLSTVVDATERGGRVITGFAAEQTAEQLQGELRGWLQPNLNATIGD